MRRPRTAWPRLGRQSGKSGQASPLPVSTWCRDDPDAVWQGAWLLKAAWNQFDFCWPSFWLKPVPEPRANGMNLRRGFQVEP